MTEGQGQGKCRAGLSIDCVGIHPGLRLLFQLSILARVLQLLQLGVLENGGMGRIHRDQHRQRGHGGGGDWTESGFSGLE